MKRNFYKITYKNIIFKDLRDKISEYLFTSSKARLYKIPKFQKLSDEDISNYSLIKPNWTYRNNIYWTPRFFIQNEISREFILELKKFRRLQEWTELDYLALTQIILTEAIRDTSYEINYNKEIKPSFNNPFHGNIDLIIFNNEENSKYNFFKYSREIYQ